jgi:hypothetical protein
MSDRLAISAPSVIPSLACPGRKSCPERSRMGRTEKLGADGCFTLPHYGTRPIVDPTIALSYRIKHVVAAQSLLDRSVCFFYVLLRRALRIRNARFCTGISKGVCANKNAGG